MLRIFASRALLSFSALVALSLCLLTPTIAAAQAPAPCVLGYTVGFFNGVGNTEADAIDGRNALQAAVRQATGNADDTYNDESVTYELFYNHTGSTVGASTLQDVAEVFIQRANEADPSGFFSGNNFYLFWEALSGNDVYNHVVGGSTNRLNLFVHTFVDSAVSSAVSSLSALLSSPPTGADYATQNAALDTLAAAGRKFLVVAHSQGNLFVNQAYDHIFPSIGSTRIKAIHIAPASPTIRGKYLLSSNDVIINPLRLQGGAGSVQANNITIPISTGDPTGHTLVGTYLDESRNGYAAVTALLVEGLGALAPGTCRVSISPTGTQAAPGNTVSFNATLNPVPTDGVLALGYAWTITGNANGFFNGPNGHVSTINTTAPNVAYNASTDAGGAGTDTVTVIAYAIKNDGSFTNAEALGTAAGTVTIRSDISNWFGTYTCTGNYTMTMSGAPFDTTKYNVPPGMNLIAVFTTTLNKGVFYYPLHADPVHAVDARAATNPAVYTTAFTLSGTTVTGSSPAPCSK